MDYLILSEHMVDPSITINVRKNESFIVAWCFTFARELSVVLPAGLVGAHHADDLLPVLVLATSQK